MPTGTLAGSRAGLVEFLTDFRSDLQAAVDQFENFSSERFQSLQPLARETWKEVQPAFGRAILRVRGMSLGPLRLHGLVGSQLALKLAFWRASRERFLGRFQRPHMPEGLRHFAARALASFLASGEEFFNSVMETIPGGGAIVEIQGNA